MSKIFDCDPLFNSDLIEKTKKKAEEIVARHVSTISNDKWPKEAQDKHFFRIFSMLIKKQFEKPKYATVINEVAEKLKKLPEFLEEEEFEKYKLLDYFMYKDVTKYVEQQQTEIERKFCPVTYIDGYAIEVLFEANSKEGWIEIPIIKSIDNGIHLVRLWTDVHINKGVVLDRKNKAKYMTTKVYGNVNIVDCDFETGFPIYKEDKE